MIPQMDIPSKNIESFKKKYACKNTVKIINFLEEHLKNK